MINPSHPTNPTTKATWDLDFEGTFPEFLWVESYTVAKPTPYGSIALSYVTTPESENKFGLDGVKFNPVDVQLSMDGVTEDNEEFPGSYVLYNKDDDDNDGINGIDDAGEVFDMDKYRADPSNEPYGINTGDKKWKSADLPVPDTSTIISGMNGYYDDAFIKVEEQTIGNTHDTFSWYRAPSAQLATADVPGDSRYWAACVGWGYEKELRYFFTCPANCEDHTLWFGDNDPDNEGVPPGYGGVSGGTVEDIIAERCMIWLESIREVSASIPKIVSHEVGHLFGLEHSEYDPATGFEATRDGIMRWKDDDQRDYTCIKEWMDLLHSHTSPDRFSDQNINDLRDWVND